MQKILRLIGWQRLPLAGRVATELLALLGVDFPAQVQFGAGLAFPHRGNGVVVAPATRLGRDVTIYHQVTIGSTNVVPGGGGETACVTIGDGAILGAGAKILAKSGTLTIGRGTVVGANSVVLTSTGENEIWAGTPARRVGVRSPAYLGVRVPQPGLPSDGVVDSRR